MKLHGFVRPMKEEVRFGDKGYHRMLNRPTYSVFYDDDITHGDPLFATPQPSDNHIDLMNSFMLIDPLYMIDTFFLKTVQNTKRSLSVLVTAIYIVGSICGGGILAIPQATVDCGLIGKNDNSVNLSVTKLNIFQGLSTISLLCKRYIST